MSKIILFYEKNDHQISATVVQGQAFAFLGELVRNFNENHITEFINNDHENRGYRLNLVSGEYEMGAKSNSYDLQNDLSNIEHSANLKNNYDAIFRIDFEKQTVLQII